MDDSDCGCLGWIILAVLGIAAIAVVLGIITYIIQTYWPILLTVIGVVIVGFVISGSASARRDSRIDFLDSEQQKIAAKLVNIEERQVSINSDRTSADKEYEQLVKDMIDASRFSSFIHELYEGYPDGAQPQKGMAGLQEQIDLISTKRIYLDEQIEDLREECECLQQTKKSMMAELDTLRAEKK